MRRIVFILLSVLGVASAYSQDVVNDSLSIDAVFNACISMRDAVAANDTAAIRQSSQELRSLDVKNFSSLRCKEGSDASLNGHLVFNEDFADSLAAGNTSVYDKADDINRSASHRGILNNGSYYTKTCFVKAGKSTKWTFASKGSQELAVVAEAGGLVTMKIHVTNSAGLDRRFDDTKNVKTGMPQRKTFFDLPTDKSNIVELEIINCGKKDCSFVVISN